MNPVTPERLTPIFAEHLGRDVGVTTVERGPVGNGQEVWFVDVDIGDDRFVLRRTAPGGPLEWTDRGREFEILVAVAAAGLPVPRVRWAEPKGGTLDGPYFVMDRMEGEPVRRVSTDVRAAVAGRSRPLDGPSARRRDRNRVSRRHGRHRRGVRNKGRARRMGDPIPPTTGPAPYRPLDCCSPTWHRLPPARGNLRCCCGAIPDHTMPCTTRAS